MKRFMIGCVAIACVVTGCGSSKDAGPTPVTSTMGTPSAGMTAPSPSVSTGSEPSSALQTPSGSPAATDGQGVAEARTLFLQYERAYQKWQVAGGSSVLPSDLSDLVADPLRTELQQLLAQQKIDGWRMAASPSPRVMVLGSISPPRAGADVELTTCVDATGVPVIGGKKDEHGVATMYRSYFKGTGGSLKYFDVEHKPVARC